MRKLCDYICDGCRTVIIADYFQRYNLSTVWKNIDWSNIWTFRVKSGKIVHYCSEECYLRCNSERRHHKRVRVGPS